MKEQNAALKTQHDQVVGFLKAREVREFKARFDGAVAELGETWKDVFGEGSGDDLNPRGAHYRNRQRVSQEMDAIEAGYKHTGQKVPGESQLFKRAVRALYGDRTKKEVVKELNKKLGDREKSMSSRPTNREHLNSMSDTQRATMAVRAKLAEYGKKSSEALVNDEF